MECRDSFGYYLFAVGLDIFMSHSLDAGAMHIGTSHDTLSIIMEQRTIHFHRCIGFVHHFLVPVKTRVVSYVRSS
jgi:hypothetical protein